MIRIVGGIFAGRSLPVPVGRETRPTSDRVREAMFNILAHRDWNVGRDAIMNAHVLDVCCGTGALALEAISRGADYACLVDLSPAAIRVVDNNVNVLGIANQCRIIRADVLQMPKAPRPCNLIFIDPPYDKNLPAQIVPGLVAQGWVAPRAIVVVETAEDETVELPPEFTLKLDREYGDTKIWFYVYEKK
ncbi:MAG: 16S rRNA (guanine(966)-N(2))-methyltransferase RsmD [Alphaproteobacteria bacterium]